MTSSSPAPDENWGWLRALWNRSWLPGLFLVVATFIAYQPVWHAGFIWDDDFYITDNPALRSLGGLWRIWFKLGATAQYYPLTFTSFWVDYHLWGLHPLGWHLTNVLLHAGNAILFWQILQRLGVRGAWLAAAIFALHPAGVESVAWVTERKNTLAGFFYLGSVLACLKFWLPGGAGSNSRTGTSSQDSTVISTNPWCYWLALALYLGALLSKTATVPLPAAVLLLVWWKRGRLQWGDVCRLLPFLAVGMAMGLITIWVEKNIGAVGNEWQFSLAGRCLIAGRAFWFYLGKLAWPHPLMFVYPRWRIDASQPAAYLPILFSLAVLLVLWRSRKGWARPVLFAFAYFLALLFPVLGFFNVYYFRYSFVADHFQYLACLGPLALAAAGMATALDFSGNKKSFLKPVLGGALLLTLGVLTWRQSGTYAGLETLWRTTLARNPDSFLGHNNLGNIFLQNGRVDEALEHFQKAIDIQPGFAEAHNNLGNALLQKGRVDEALEHFQKAIDIQPGFAEAHNNLGNIFLQNGQVDEAVAHFQKALAFQPNNAEIYYNLGNALLDQRDADGALRCFQKAVEIAPDFAGAQENLGMILFQKGQLDEAILHCQKAVAIQPVNAEFQYHLGYALFRNGESRGAIAHYQKTLELQPQNAVASQNLAWILATCPEASVRNGRQAVEWAGQAVRLSGGTNPIFIGTLAAAYAEAGRFSEAVETAQHARQLAAAQNNAALVDVLQMQIGLYQAGSPFRDASQTNIPAHSE